MVYENRMFTNKVKWGGKGKYRVMMIKSLVNMGVGRGALRGLL